MNPFILNDDSLTLTKRCKIILDFCIDERGDVETFISNYNLDDLHQSFLKSSLIAREACGAKIEDRVYYKINEAYLKKKRLKK